MGRQFVVQVANRPGVLAHLARAEAMSGISISHVISHVASVGAGDVACADDDEPKSEVVGAHA